MEAGYGGSRALSVYGAQGPGQPLCTNPPLATLNAVAVQPRVVSISTMCGGKMLMYCLHVVVCCINSTDFISSVVKNVDDLASACALH